MPCYIEHTKPPSKNEYDIWKEHFGYMGTFEEYLQREKNRPVGERIFITGNLGDHCADCSGVGDFLCDYPVGKGKTCDRPICEDHAHEIGIEIHYCKGHYKMWSEFKDAGGVNKSLQNVIAFKAEK